MRRRLGWVAAMLGVVGVVGLLVVLIPGRPNEPEAPLVEGGYLPPEPEIPLRRRNRELIAPLDVASKFILTAVVRKNVGESWEITVSDVSRQERVHEGDVGEGYGPPRAVVRGRAGEMAPRPLVRERGRG